MAVPKEKSRQKTTPVSHLYQADGTIGEIKDAKARDRIAANKAEADSKIDALGDRITGLWNTIYPVGAIYMSANSASPASLFGGTWERVTGRFLLAATDSGGTGGNSTASVKAGYTGGEASHTLNVDEMPAHTHPTSQSPRINEDTGGTRYSHNSGSGAWWFCAVTTETKSRGGDQAHNNMPPYLAVYVWKRVA